jgi:hypothetical protein
MSVFDPATTEGPRFYENTDWAEPLFERVSASAFPRAEASATPATSPSLPPTAAIPQAVLLHVRRDGGVQEHCNAFVYYYPANDTTDVNCF